MKVRHIVAASLIGTVGVLAATGIASARTAPSAQNRPASCANAASRVSKIEARVAKLEQRIATLQTGLATPQSGKHGGSAKSIQKRIDKASQKHDHLGKVISEINTRCAT
jgi:peptidoglycan hydrolase CwlO-like protein